ncbi:MAG: FAD-dependent monooxygenase [Pseudomonadota bacterium]
MNPLLSSSAPPSVDVAVLGAGPVGASLALALARRGLSVVALDTRGLEEAQQDPRVLALSHGSRLILERLDVWPLLREVSPIRVVHVSEQGAWPRVELTGAEAGVPVLGYTVEYGRLMAALAERLQATCALLYLPGVGEPRIEACHDGVAVGFRHRDEPRAFRARLLAVADGGATAGRLGFEIASRDYRQSALTARVRADSAPAGVAFERFTPEGPVALLPCVNDYALIWTAVPERAAALAALAPDAFCAALQERFGHRLGRFRAVEGRAVFPLVLRRARDIVGPRTVLVGNAAHTLHPVAGQGLNLGLRDAWELAEHLAQAPREEIGDPAHLHRYRRRRSLDVGAGVAFTDTLVRVFSNDNLLMRWGRTAGLAGLGLLPPARRFLARRMIFGPRAL